MVPASHRRARSPALTLMVTLPPFQTLLDEHAAALHRFLVASVGPHDGADCFQETVIAALRAYPALRHADNLRGWLFTIAHRKVIDHPAGWPARREAGGGAAPNRPCRPGAGRRGLWPPSPSCRPSSGRRVVQRYLLDLAYAEVAVILGCSEAAARQNVRAGLASLRN